MLHTLRRTVLLAILAIAGMTASCGSPPVAQRQPAVADSILLPSTDAVAVAHAYQERLRIGLGSPFRLIEMVLRDERLGNARKQVAGQLIRAMQDGRMYEVSPLVLVDAGADSTTAIAQLDLIRDAIERSHDARAGERAVILAYQQLARDSVVSDSYLQTVVRVAALLRDRQLASTDVRRLRAAAEEFDVNPVDLILRWRRERLFIIEQPTLTALNADARAEADRLATLLNGGVRAALTPVRSELARKLVASEPALTAEDATRVLELAAHTQPPPQNALVITLRAIARGAADTRARAAAEHWQLFLQQPQDEEAFVAGLLASARDSGDDRVVARVALAAAIALRPFAQERLAYSDSVTPALLQKQYVVRVRIDEKLPRSWQRATLNNLGGALADLRDVLPGIELAGLTFQIRAIESDARYQAYHDPRNRVIRIDPAAAAGTLAHELGHDVDWQLARRKYNTTSSYATDYAVRKRKALAYLIATFPSDERPAEAFARRFEWYVAAALAAQGRSNGYLSSVQSEWIAGYGAAVRPDATLLARSSFATLLAQGAALDRDGKAAAEALISGANDTFWRELTVSKPFPNRF